MRRTPPRAVLHTLRKEVGFGCPVPDCREAILTWHHFDPPWREEHHHRSEGMIALCRTHAAAADRELYTNAQLRAWKASPCAIEAVQTRLPWATQDFLIRLGGCYSGGELVPLLVGGKPVISLRRDVNGFLLVSAEFQTPEGITLARLDENMFEADPAQISDLTMDTAPTHIKVWFAKREIGMEVCYRRVSLDDLNEVLAKDRKRGNAAALGNLSPEMQKLIKRLAAPREIGGMSRELGLPDDIREARLSGDPTGCIVRKYAEQHAEGGTVPFLDFRILHIHSDNREISVQDGLAASIFYSASFENERGGFNL